ncbi:hypothetical protein F2Q70_00014219 [Brassica cretica]|uniref:Uncharacterized protein n=1 Tax=Brassica cretica TaxID=69181 RepID=A0A8S9I547_BRACR|nr:hypothetical protein F2Q70_00014219 [Brassica cretica]
MAIVNSLSDREASLQLFVSFFVLTTPDLSPLRSRRTRFSEQPASAMGTGREASLSLDGVRDKNMMQLKKLNTVLFPVRYNDK